jgi:hypothetical protein
MAPRALVRLVPNGNIPAIRIQGRSLDMMAPARLGKIETGGAILDKRHLAR